jgi:hypothetical protein
MVETLLPYFIIVFGLKAMVETLPANNAFYKQ